MTSRVRAPMAGVADMGSSVLATGAAVAFIAFAAALGVVADPAPDHGGLRLRGTLAPNDQPASPARLPAVPKRV